MRKKLDLNIIDIIKFYNSGMSAMAISKQLNCSEKTIQIRLIQEGVKSRSLKECHPNKVNHNYFEQINTEEKAYWLGFIYADGCVHIHKQKGTDKIYYQYIISLGQTERCVIDDFRKAVESSHKVSIYKPKIGAIAYKLNISSEKMFIDLNRHGVIERKSLKLTNPTTVPKELIRHFIRGYFDGDGSICKTTSKRKSSTWSARTLRSSVSICGTYSFLSWMWNELGFLTIKNKLIKEKRRNTNTWSLRFCGNKQVDAFYKYLYESSIVFLSRKKLKFEECFKERGSTTIIGNPIRGPYKNSKWIKV